MKTLFRVERAIVRERIIEEYGADSPFLDQLAGAGVENREFAGHGVFVNLRLADNTAPVDSFTMKSRGDTRRRCLLLPTSSASRSLSAAAGSVFSRAPRFGGGLEWPGELLEDWLVMRPIMPARQKAR